MRTVNGRPDFGMRGVKGGAAAEIVRTAASNWACPSRSRYPGQRRSPAKFVCKFMRTPSSDC
jgi:hypothetical protein